MRASENDFLIISHRGASAYMPENTMGSFRKAIEMNADMIELDVRKTRDDMLVVIHDSKIDRTTDGTGYVRDKTFDELRQYDAGTGERIPSLEEVFTLGREHAGYVIELKEERTEDQVIGMIKDYGFEDRVFLVSFRKKVIKYIKTVEPGIKTALITVIPFGVLKKGLQCGADAIGVSKYFINKRLVINARNNDLFIFAWTVDDPGRCRDLKNLGLNGVVTNKPDILRL